MTNLLNKSLISALSFLLVMAFTPITNAAENPFGMSDTTTNQITVAEKGKCGGDKKMEGKEGKCGGDKKMEGKEGKCGGDKKKEGKCGGGKKMEGKCGEGKCGGKK
jgi:uncharacterized low-complexity protein